MNYPYNIKSDYGFFHPYSFFMMMGIVATVLLSTWQLKRRGIKVNLAWMLTGSAIVVFCGLLGGSYFGKFHSPEAWYQKLEFWDPGGGMGIYGAILFGTIAFFGYFTIFCHLNKVSLWSFADAIVPNILLAQAIGRWGNFFNHEVLGGKAIPRSALDWLPPFIADNCRLKSNFEPGHLPVYHAPLFLYESFGLFLGWVVITFVVARMSEWIGPRRPDWVKLPRAVQTQKRSWWQGFKFWSPAGQFNSHISPRQLWLRDYFHSQPTVKMINQTSPRYIYRLYNPHHFFVVRSGVATGFYFVFWNLVRGCLTPLRQPAEFYTRIPPLVNYHFSEHPTPATPAQIAVELSFMMAILALGIGMIIVFQLGFFDLWRRVGFMYEKPYLDLNDPQTWQLEHYCAMFVKNGVGNEARSFLRTIAAFVSWTLGERINESDLKSYFKIIKMNCYVPRAEDVTLRVLMVLRPTQLAVGRWKFPVRSFLWEWDQRINLLVFKPVLRKFFRREGGLAQSIDTIFAFPQYQTAIKKQIRLRFCQNSSNLSLFISGLLFIDSLPHKKRRLLITPKLLRENSLFKMNRKLKISVPPSKISMVNNK